jgi:hypothetical protein
MDLFDIIEIFSSMYNISMTYNNIDSNTYKFIVENNNFNVNINNNKFIPNNDHYETKLICDKLSKKTYNDIAEIIEEICNVCKNIKNYCIACDKKLDFSSDILTTCGGDKCQYKLEELIIDNDVFDYIKKYPDTVKLLVDIASYAIESQRCMDLFDPFPPYFLRSSVNIDRGQIAKLKMTAEEYIKYNATKEIGKIKEEINKIKKLDYNKIIETPSDKLIANKYGNDFYYLLRFIIKSCKFELTLDKQDKNLYIYKIKNNFIDEDNFKNKVKNHNNEKCLLFHGSQSECWYSILRNGLKVMSSTAMMTAGAAYGAGIYTSDNYSTSLGYTRFNNNPIIGVYEIVGLKDKYRKVSTIYVLPSNDICILRYLIVGPASDNNVIVNINKLVESDLLLQ